jgi:hypothetical protein
MVEGEITCLTGPDDDRDDHRGQRRRYEEPLAVKVRKQMLAIAESVRAVEIQVGRGRPLMSWHPHIAVKKS